MQLKDFATDKFPLHCSKLPEFLSCAWKSVMAFLEIHQRDGGAAAHTGSAVHKAVHKWHTTGKEVDKALAAMKAVRDEYPLADFLEAERLFRFYIADPRNANATVVHAETLLQGEIAKGVVLEGTVDQIREEEGMWRVYDLKTSRLSGPQIRDTHTVQVAAYAYLATKRFRRPVLPGAVIMVRAYEKRNEAFLPYSLTIEDVNRMMEMVNERVREVRTGHLVAVPGELCGYCIGVSSCFQRLQEYEHAL